MLMLRIQAIRDLILVYFIYVPQVGAEVQDQNSLVLMGVQEVPVVEGAERAEPATLRQPHLLKVVLEVLVLPLDMIMVAGAGEQEAPDVMLVGQLPAPAV